MEYSTKICVYLGSEGQAPRALLEDCTAWVLGWGQVMYIIFVSARLSCGKSCCGSDKSVFGVECVQGHRLQKLPYKH